MRASKAETAPFAPVHDQSLCSINGDSFCLGGNIKLHISGSEGNSKVTSTQPIQPAPRETHLEKLLKTQSLPRLDAFWGPEGQPIALRAAARLPMGEGSHCQSR